MSNLNLEDEANPWRLVNSKEIYSNFWISLREDQVIRPDGNPGIYSVVTTRLAVAVMAVDNDGQIYLVGQYRYPTNRYSWELIEGGSDDSESSLETAKRELLEEAGLEAKTWRQLGSEIQLSNCYSAELGVVYLAEDLTFVGARPEATEKLKTKKVTLEEFLHLVDSGVITDALSIIALHRYLRDKK